MAPPIRQAGSSSHHPCLFPSCVSRQEWTKVTVVRRFVPLIVPSMAVRCPGARLRGTSCGIVCFERLADFRSRTFQRLRVRCVFAWSVRQGSSCTLPCPSQVVGTRCCFSPLRLACLHGDPCAEKRYVITIEDILANVPFCSPVSGGLQLWIIRTFAGCPPRLHHTCHPTVFYGWGDD